MGHEIPRAGGFVEPPVTIGGKPHVFTQAPRDAAIPPQPAIELLPDEAAYLKYKRQQAKRDRIRSLWGHPVQTIAYTASQYQIDISQFGTTAALVEAIADAEYPPMDLPPTEAAPKVENA